MKELLKLKRLYLLLLFPLGVLLILLARLDNGWVEHFYLPFIYKPLSYAIGSVCSSVSFSVTEMLVVLAVAFLIYYIIKNFKKPLRVLINLLCTAAVAFFLFQICMGLNYYRYEAKEYLDIEVKPATKEQLYDLCVTLAEDMNKYRAELETDENGVAKLIDKNRSETAYSAMVAYKNLSADYGFLKSADIRNKPLLSSKLFSRVLTTGIYIPYTFESNINVDVPEHTIPATMCHELTHYRGFMRENEANFLGYLACTYSDRPDFKYSGALMAFEYAYPKLSKEDKVLAGKIATMLEDGVIKDIGAEEEYWDKYRKTVVADISDRTYNTYLNANGQTSGTKSYGEMVDLLIAYHENLKDPQS